MAERALFSSFRRPGSLTGSAVQDETVGLAATQHQKAPAVPEQNLIDVSEPDTDAFEPPLADAGIAGTEPPEAAKHAAPIQRENLSVIGLKSDQLGLVHPDVITLCANLPNSPSVMLEAGQAGIYRPPGFRAAPWSGFAYDQPQSLSTGLATGTRILTARGEVEVEKLVPGDAALTLRSPALLPISWIGRAAGADAPVRIEPGALGPDIPRRALDVGPDHAVYINAAPVAARTLVNGTTIRRVEAGRAELFHVDVGRAEVILAEGLALSSSHGASSPAR